MSNYNDKVSGYSGDDLFVTGTGNDTIDGGSGTDLVRVQSSSSDYNISYSGGQLKLSKSGDTKYLKNVEYVEFTDGAFATSQFQLGKISNVYDAQDGSINIYKTKSGSYIMDRAGLSVNSYTSDDAGILYASNGKSYHKFSSDPKALDWYGDINIFRGSGNSWSKDIFQTDYNTGHYKYYKTEKLSLSELLAYETERQIDINKDLAIGDKVSDVLSNNSGSKGFYKLASGPYIIDNNGLNIGSSPQNSMIPSKNGSTFNFKYTPTGAISTDEYDQYGGHTPVIYVTSQNNSRLNTWTYDAFNSNTGEWEYSSGSFTYSELLNFEKAFNTDLNDDGKVGDTITEVFSQHSQKNKGLYKGESGAIVIDQSDLLEGSQTSSPLVLKKGNSLYTNKQKSLGLATDEKWVNDNYGGYHAQESYIYFGSGNSWTRDNFEDGIYKNSSKLTLSQLLADESLYQVDLNKDNVIGDTVTKVISNQDSKGFYKIASGSYVIDNSGLHIGNVSQNPIVPTNDGKIHTFKYTPTGAKNYEYWDPQQNENVQTLDVYSNSGNNWMLDTFDSNTGNLISSNKYLYSQILIR